MKEADRKRMQNAVTVTLEELRIKVSCAQSFNDDGDPEEALKFVKEIHALSYVGEGDYKP